MDFFLRFWHEREYFLAGISSESVEESLEESPELLELLLEDEF